MKCYLITYECERGKGYSATHDVIDWLERTDKHSDAPFFILNVLEITEKEFYRIDMQLRGM